ncbi:putative WRKY transcription factor 11 [Bidens hawaiensis]|uniref:putative WRKY transcription factor 11 n=1 Tax=Bidens hawaiensis TaxID=980011 RepID=UPI00404A3A9E
MAVDFVGIQAVEHLNRIFNLNNHEFAVSDSFKHAVSAFKRSGHARFRRGPSVSKPSEGNLTENESPERCTDKSITDVKADADAHNTHATASFQWMNLMKNESLEAVNEFSTVKSVTAVNLNATASFQSMNIAKIESPAAFNECCTVKSVAAVKADAETNNNINNNNKTVSYQSMNSSFVGGSVEGSVSNGRQLSALGMVVPEPSFSSRKPPLPSSHRKRLGTDTPSASLQGSGSRTACHCCKKRKTGSKREVRRIPIIGSKVESIPADDYSWKKYGEKKADGSPFPRVYYKCNSVKGCRARKCVEVALTNSKMLIVTYDGEHRHHHHRHTPTPLPSSLNKL